MTIVKDYRPFEARPGPMKPLIPFVAMGDELATPRQIAAAVVAASGAKPKYVVDVGSFIGEFLEAFLEKFPDTRGQWTDASENSLPIAAERFARFGDRVDYVVGCPGRDTSDGNVPKGVDVLMTSWVSSHRDAEGTVRFYKDAVKQLAPGGWLIVIDHIGFNDPVWEKTIIGAREGFHVNFEGPPPHHENNIADRDCHLKAFAAAGISNAQVVWESLGTVLFMGRLSA